MKGCDLVMKRKRFSSVRALRTVDSEQVYPIACESSPSVILRCAGSASMKITSSLRAGVSRMWFRRRLGGVAGRRAISPTVDIGLPTICYEQGLAHVLAVRPGTG